MTRFIHLLLVYCITANALVQFHFTGKLHCSRPNFRYQIFMFENDILVDNLISNMPPVNSHSPHIYRADGQDTHDGCVIAWPFLFLCDYFFEIYFAIIHNCTFDGKYRKFEIDMGKHYITDGLLNKTVDIHVENIGMLALDQRDPQ